MRTALIVIYAALILGYSGSFVAVLAFSAYDILKNAGVIQPPPPAPAPQPAPKPVELKCRQVDYIFETKLVCEEK